MLRGRKEKDTGVIAKAERQKGITATEIVAMPVLVSPQNKDNRTQHSIQHDADISTDYYSKII